MSMIPNVYIYEKQSAMDFFEQALKEYNRKNYYKTVEYFDNVKVMDNTSNELNVFRAMTKIELGELWPARLAVEKHLQQFPLDEQASNMLSNIVLKLGNSQPQYEDFKAHIESVEGQLMDEQAKYLFNKVKSLNNDANILEIGSGFGKSTVSLAFSCVGTNKQLYSIDSFGYESGYLNVFFDIWYNTVIRFDLERFVIPLIGASNEQLLKWGDKPKLDFVFIDASSDYTDVIKDFELVYPLVKNEGLIAFHNVDCPGPMKVWYETAAPLLMSHENCGNILCGRKNSR